MKTPTQWSIATATFFLCGTIGTSIMTVSAEDIPPDLSCDQITQAMKMTHYGSASYLRMVDQYNRLCIEVKSGCTSNANLATQATSCTKSDMYFEYYIDPSSCKQVRCRETPPQSSSSARSSSSSVASATGPCPNGDQLTELAVICRKKYEKYEYFTDNGCRQLRCIPNVTSQGSCPSPESLREKAALCKNNGRSYESYTDGVCKVIRCLDESIGSTPYCPNDDTITVAAMDCKKHGTNAAIATDVHGCRKVTCSVPFSSASSASSCPSNDELDRGLQVCRNSGMHSTTMPDDNGCRQVFCQAADESSAMHDVPEASVSDCATMRAELIWMINNKQTDSSTYAETKKEFTSSCQEQRNEPPAAGFEDEVLTNDDLSAIQSPFPDADTNSLNGKAAVELFRRGVIGGFPDGTFKGERPVNRAEAAKFLLLACAKDTDAPYSGRLRDIAEGQWYTPFVEAAAEQGIIAGYPDGSFRPANTVIRAEFLKMLTRACGLQEGTPYAFKDVSSNDWFSPYAGVAEKYEVFPNASRGLLQPAKVLSRDDVAIAIYQYLSLR